MSDLMQQVMERQQRARTFRKKGDALRKADREQAAIEAYQAGVAELILAHGLLKSFAYLHAPLGTSEEAMPALRELVEVCGALGGLYQRLDMLDKALTSYSEGADIEERLDLRSTYNRLNAVKYLLLSGKVSSSEVIPKVRQLADLINANLRADMSTGDSGWALADLGDCLALLGQVEEARQTYAKFIAKAELKSPERALEVLKKIASSMQMAQDPDARRVQVAVEMLASNLATS